MKSADQIRTNLTFSDIYQPGVVCYFLDGKAVNDSFNKVVVIFNGNPNKVEVEIPNSKYTVVVDQSEINEDGIETVSGGQIKMEPTSAKILVSGLENS